MINIGDIVTITIDYPLGGVRGRSVKNETGVIVEKGNYDETEGPWRIATGEIESDGWWFTKDEFRPATADEIEARLRFLLMRKGW